MVRKPPFFCAVTETARDITEKNTHTQLPPHPLEARILPPLPEDLLHQHIPLGSLTKDVVTLLEVYVDNFIGMTNHPRRSYRLQLSRAMLHGIHSLFPPQNLPDTVAVTPSRKKNWTKKTASGRSKRKR